MKVIVEIDWPAIGSVPSQLARLKRQVEAMWAPDDQFAGTVVVRIVEEPKRHWWWI